ncbi:molybdopterin-dependent oxidoreductase [Rhizobium sp. SL86]|uniref:molybdopterin-dependent oxidoreductase n=1 Tax=Rhizobium sp. SL86 TaxID=2995148 RepID=UPI0022729AD2|nr:molybdopterin-dependent oxidoreductase [Rhizobium sp. SL86]MCY1668386.1 molybdopterin-dependent oxidoreductase [Rhizobium sp. SL86]
MMKRLKPLLTFLAVVLTAPHALALDAPKGPVILTVRGTLATPNVDGTAQFDLAMLEKLAGRKVVTETPWTEGKTEFSGPLLRAILEAAGAKGKTLLVRAINDYFAEVPMEDATALQTILASRMNGKVMSVRDKGPLFLIYPFDLDPKLYNEKYFSRSVWQIKEIEVKS